MNRFDDAVASARAAGHDLIWDPPVLASVGRYTCKACGKAVLGNRRTAYGAATEAPCERGASKPVERETTTTARWDST